MDLATLVELRRPWIIYSSYILVRLEHNNSRLRRILVYPIGGKTHPLLCCLAKTEVRF